MVAQLLFLGLMLAHLGALAQSGPDRPYSYICLSAEQKLCLGISTGDEVPSYESGRLYYLQVKHRTRVEDKGIDWMRTRWSVDRAEGRIQLANFTSLCLTRMNNQWDELPGKMLLRPCGTSGNLEIFNLTGLRTPEELSQLKLRARNDQCLTLMNCESGSSPDTNYCNPEVTKPFTGTKFNDETQRGSYVKMMPCKPNNPAQMWTQQIDCAPGCSPYMMEGPNNKCDPECANDECNWDNWACATPSPTPPTLSPTHSPTTSPTTSSPSEAPSHSPSISPTPMPSSSPTTSSPTSSPTTSRPSLSPSSAPSYSPTSSPSHAPSSTPTTSTPTSSPSASPTTSSPTFSPSSSPSSHPSRSPTLSPEATPPIARLSNGSDLTWLWILLGVLLPLLLLLCIFLVLCYGRRKKREAEQEEQDVIAKARRPKHLGSDDDEGDIESPIRPSWRSRKPYLGDEDEPQVVVVVKNDSNKNAKQQPPSPEKAPSSDPLYNIFPLQSPLLVRTVAGEPSDALMDAPPSAITFSDGVPMTPRSAAAQTAINPDSSKRPPGAAPGLAWSGSQVDLSAAEDGQRSFIRQQSRAVQEDEIPQRMAERSFKMPKETVHEATSPGDGA